MNHSTNLKIVKFGGSVISDKGTTPPSMNTRLVSRLTDEIKKYHGPLVVVLGGGAHGHQAAKKYGYDRRETSIKTLLAGIPDIRYNMTSLSTDVLMSFRSSKIDAVVLSPFCFVKMNDGEITDFPLDIIISCLESNLTAIIHGDVCFDMNRGASILSGDSIISWLANKLNPRSVLLGTDVDGIFDKDPKTNPKAKLIPLISSDNINEVLKLVGPSTTTDVTGGMAKKIQEVMYISRRVSEIAVFNLAIPERLGNLLHGKNTLCTRIISNSAK